MFLLVCCNAFEASVRKYKTFQILKLVTRSQLPWARKKDYEIYQSELIIGCNIFTLFFFNTNDVICNIFLFLNRYIFFIITCSRKIMKNEYAIYFICIPYAHNTEVLTRVKPWDSFSCCIWNMAIISPNVINDLVYVSSLISPCALHFYFIFFIVLEMSTKCLELISHVFIYCSKELQFSTMVVPHTVIFCHFLELIDFTLMVCIEFNGESICCLAKTLHTCEI